MQRSCMLTVEVPLPDEETNKPGYISTRLRANWPKADTIHSL